MIYKLEDGQEVHTFENKRTLRDAKAELASLPKSPEWFTEAMFTNGEFVGIRATVTLGFA